MPPIPIVDDESATLSLLQDVLEDEGYEVVTAGDGQAALLLMQQTAVALVLTDYMMPRMNGVEFCTRLRADPATAAVPVFLLSAVPPVTADGLFTSVISKPFDIH